MVAYLSNTTIFVGRYSQSSDFKLRRYRYKKCLISLKSFYCFVSDLLDKCFHFSFNEFFFINHAEQMHTHKLFKV